MASLTFKSFPAGLHRKLRLQASRHKRSMTKEVVALIEEGLARHRPIDVETVLKRARRFRASLNFTITDDEISRLKREGRP